MYKYFEVVYRDTGHWDIYSSINRLAKIRGKQGNYKVIRESSNIEDKEGFKTVQEAMQYICSIIMKEE